METYLNALEASTIPIPQWGIVIAWLIIYASAHILARMCRALSRTQQFVVTGGPPGLVKEQSLKIMLVQIILSAAVFASASFIGGPFFVFFAGGWLVTTAVSIPLTLRKIFYLRALSQPGAAEGSVTLSSQLAVKDAAFQLFGIAAFCLLLGIVFAHLALLGGALYISATAFGYFRKAKGKARA
jgi:hypothetical protein